MLEVKCQPHFDKVIAFAEKKGLKEQFEERLAYLRTYADPEQTGKCVVELHHDFAPASFSVLWKKNGEVWMNGALIYHGDQTGWRDPDAYVDPLSVRVGSSDDNPWSIHT